VETAAFLAADGGGGTVDLDIDADGETLSVVVSASGRRVTFAIAPPPVGGAGKPAGQLSRFAAAMAAKGKVAAGAVIAASWLLGVALHLTFVSTISAVGIVWSMIQVALRLGFVLPLVSAMPVERAARPLRFFGLVFAAAMAGEWYYQIVVGRFFGNPWPAVATMSALAPVSSIAVVFVSVAAAAAVVRMLKVGRTAFAHDQRALSSELRLRESQERFLRWQMSPHFLFNALNSLAALIRRDPAMAARFFGMLDHFFEQVASLEGRTHTLDEEIRLLSSYFAIERVRFGEAISFIVDADPALRQAPVPALILQPLAENATKHGVLREGTMAIGLAVRNTGSGLRISMSNPSEEPQTARRDGAGLRITRERLAAAYGDRANLETTFAGGWFTATMLLSSRP
jgi:hypothetical protein